MIRRLVVWWDERVVGELTQDRHGDIGFAYDSGWIDDPLALALSASLPKRVKPFSRRECRPFFGGLLPEESQREAAARALGVSPANDYAMLDRLGGDVAGALQLLPPGERPLPPTTALPRELDDDALTALLDRLPARPLLAGEGALRLSLAGAQVKLPVVLMKGALALPLPGQPTTHILKPPIAGFPATTENEAFVMRLAAAIGLDVAAVEARTLRQRSFLLVTRYDRALSGDGTVRRVHQEDFCQALGVPSEIKYASEGGPGLKDCFALVRLLSALPAVDVLKLLDAVIFNLAVGNADAHGKNFSLLHGLQGARLTPLYDLLSTVLYPELSAGMAMKIGKRATLEEMDARGWAAFAVEAGIGLPLIRRRVDEVCALIEASAGKVAGDLSRPGLDAAAIERHAALVVERARHCAWTVRPAKPA